MDLVPFLTHRSTAILDEAAAGVLRAGLQHYQESGLELTRKRLERLFTVVLDCLSRRTVLPILESAEQLAGERHSGGFDLREVQTAFNTLEEAIWRQILREMSPADFAEAIGLVSTVLGAGKDALARSYVSLATKTKAPSMNLRALFQGTERP